jgi:hypothetical protein
MPLTANPLAGISKAFQAPVKQHLPTFKPEQLPELMVALSDYLKSALFLSNRPIQQQYGKPHHPQVKST